MTEAHPTDRPPLLPWLLGLAGMVPFTVGAAAYLFGPGDLAPESVQVLLIYAATVLSFLGGVRWGAEIDRSPRPGWGVMAASVLPPITAWALVAAPLDVGLKLSGFLAAFVLQWFWDARTSLLPAWYRRLRGFLTIGAFGTVGAALLQAIRNL